MQPRTVEAAPAKINLTLHVTGQRSDGYHLLDSVVMFADVGDRLEYWAGGALSLSVIGPNATGVPQDGSNLVLKAAKHMGVRDGTFRLTKVLPPASGIGGGSADAAAAIRLLDTHPDRTPLNMPEQLGADIPACLMSRTLRMQGIGQVLTPLPGLPPLWAIMVNPRVELPTPAVFANLETRENPAQSERLPAFQTAPALIDWLRMQRNDLQIPAIKAQPVIADVLNAVSDLPDCQLVRMSGSGATCFGLFPGKAGATLAAELLQQEFPNWWITQTRLGDPA